jgi:hypothetical protein
MISSADLPTHFDHSVVCCPWCTPGADYRPSIVIFARLAGGLQEQIMLARATSTCAKRLWAPPRDRLPFGPSYATIESIALLGVVSGIFCCLTGSTFMTEAYDDWVTSSGGAACMSLAILDLVLLVVRDRRRSRSGSRSNRRATKRSSVQSRPLKSSYGAIPEKVRGQTYADTLMWRCAVPQRAGPGGGADGLDTKS